MSLKPSQFKPAIAETGYLLGWTSYQGVPVRRLRGGSGSFVVPQQQWLRQQFVTAALSRPVDAPPSKAQWLYGWSGPRLHSHPVLETRLHGCASLVTFVPCRMSSSVSATSSVTTTTTAALTKVSTTEAESSIPIGIAQESSNLIPTVQEALIAGVWQSTTAKRDKLLELKAELMSKSSSSTDATTAGGAAKPSLLNLDDAATDRQKLDLWLVDGLQHISKAAETREPSESGPLLRSLADNVERTLVGNPSLVAAPQTTTDLALNPHQPLYLNQVQWESSLESIYKQLEIALAALPPPSRCLHSARDFMVIPVASKDDASTSATNKDSNASHSTQSIPQSSSIGETTMPEAALTNQYFEYSVTRFRIQTAMAVVSNLQKSWSKWTTVTDQDVDRAAVRLQQAPDTNSTLATPGNLLPRRDYLAAVIVTCLCDTSPKRLDALWRLMDRDDDGLLDQVEMDYVCSVTVKVSEEAVRQQLQEALDAAPLDWIASETESDAVEASPTSPKVIGWRQRRREKSAKLTLTKMMQKTLNQHFDDELEMASRLRCIYAWANKAHQNNKVDSVLVSTATENGGSTGIAAASLTGRQRYVELHPKIALQEFRQVQEIHFTQLDRVGSEFLSSFRDEILVHQGKQRQNRELQRDCAVFFVAVCLLDYVILTL